MPTTVRIPTKLPLCRALWLAAFAVAIGLAGCGGGGAGASEPEATAPSDSAPADPEQARRQQALARLQVRQDAVCERVKKPLIACSVEDAHANLTPEQIAELDLENTVPRAEAEFLAKCRDSDMSPRQVKVFEQCLADTTCAVFVPCLDQAQKRP